MLGFCLTWACTGVSMVSQLLWFHMCNFSVLSRKQFHCSHLPLLAFSLFFNPFHDTWALRGCRCGIDVSFMAEYFPQSLILCTLSSSWPVLIAIYCKKDIFLVRVKAFVPSLKTEIWVAEPHSGMRKLNPEAYFMAHAFPHTHPALPHYTTLQTNSNNDK